jgi:hypothetical protein
VTLLASITRRRLGPCLAVEGTTTREVFETYMEHVLAPTLRPVCCRIGLSKPVYLLVVAQRFCV